MAINSKKKGRLYGLVNNNPWTRNSQESKRRIAPAPPKSNPSKMNLSAILTGRRRRPSIINSASKREEIGLPNVDLNNANLSTQSYDNMGEQGPENRGGERRAPFLSNTGPGKKQDY
jgi:hypothetical protein